MSNRVFSQSFSKRQKFLPAQHSVEISELHSCYISQKLREINVLISNFHTTMNCFHEILAEFYSQQKFRENIELFHKHSN